jgi:phosphate transport system permease protein
MFSGGRISNPPSAFYQRKLGVIMSETAGAIPRRPKDQKDNRQPVTASANGAQNFLALIQKNLFMATVYLACGLFGLILIGLVVVLISGSWQSIKVFGIGFLWSTTWDPVNDVYGALSFIFGTIVSSLIALALASGVGILSALFLAEFAPAKLSGVLGILIELLAAVPSVVYGLWGLFVLCPIVQLYIGPFLQDTLGFLPIFKGIIYGVNMLDAALILTLMIVPTVMSISRDLIVGVPGRYREATLALGATRWEAVTSVVLPMVQSGVFGACMLAFGRALGETIATTMVIGNRPAIAASLFKPGYTIASVIANEFTEATSNLYVSALIELGLLLLIISIIINALGRIFLSAMNKNAGG